MNYLDRPSVFTRVLTRGRHEGQSRRRNCDDRNRTERAREKREQERKRLIFFSFIITSSGFKKIFTLQKNIKGGRKPSLGEHSSPDED